MTVRDLKEIIKNVPNDMEIELATFIKTPPGTYIKTEIIGVRMRDKEALVIEYEDELCGDSEGKFRLGFNPRLKTDVFEALEENECEYDFEESGYVVVTQDGIDVLDAVGVDYEIVA